MACYHLTLKVMSRKGGEGHSAPHGVAYRSGGRGATITKVEKVGGVSAVAAAAYRSGEAIVDERQRELGTRLEPYDYGAKGHILHTEIMTPEGDLPEWATHRSALWNAVERAEKRKDAVVAREVEVMLPRELSMAENLTLVRRLCADQFVSKGLIVDLAIHEPTASDGLPHKHCHIMITPRPIGPEGFHAYKDQTFWWAGQGDKSKEELEKLRAIWARMQNDALAAAGSSARVDHRSLAAQREEAIDQAAQAHAAGQEHAAQCHAARAELLMRTPQKPRGISPLIQAAGKTLERKLRYQWAAIRRKAERMTHGTGSGGELFGLLARAAEFMRGYTLEPPPRAREAPVHDIAPWQGWEPEHGR
jgi:ATP-dependent exoDNAse (exonuclease V) alpha subunit